MSKTFKDKDGLYGKSARFVKHNERNVMRGRKAKAERHQSRQTALDQLQGDAHDLAAAFPV